ncbi:ribbon-helix-helix domain-containing protein [Candidatus Woesearchaeota archaeon]|nr:ribbon-helix-helix domain-containing protein [Candidatus Woesearchaeota archaeon]
MKFKTSVTFDEETIDSIRDLIKLGLFRNKSHAIEYSIKKFIKEVKNG